MIYIISDDSFFSLGAQHLFDEQSKKTVLIDCHRPDVNVVQYRFSKRDTLILATDNVKIIALVVALARLYNTHVIFVVDQLGQNTQELIELRMLDVITKSMPTEALLHLIDAEAGPRDRMPALTARETHVMELLAKGNTPQRISAALSISIKTVCTHKVSALKKLGLNHLNARSVFIYGQIHAAMR